MGFAAATCEDVYLPRPGTYVELNVIVDELGQGCHSCIFTCRDKALRGINEIFATKPFVMITGLLVERVLNHHGVASSCFPVGRSRFELLCSPDMATEGHHRGKACKVFKVPCGAPSSREKLLGRRAPSGQMQVESPGTKYGVPLAMVFDQYYLQIFLLVGSRDQYVLHGETPDCLHGVSLSI